MCKNVHLFFCLFCFALNAEAQISGKTDTASCFADFSFDVSGTEVSFTNLSYNEPPLVSYFWDFGDDNFSTQENPAHIYSGFGYYNACLTTSSDSCNDVKCKVLNVVGSQDAALSQLYWFAIHNGRTLLIQINNVFPGTYQLEMVNLSGSVVSEAEWNCIGGSAQSLQMHIPALPAGMYVLTMHLDATFLGSKKIVIE